jgi:hypothetical protein
MICRISDSRSPVVKSPIFWNIKPCNPVKINRHLGETCRLQLQSRRISQERDQHKVGWIPTAPDGVISQMLELSVYGDMPMARLIKESGWQSSDKTWLTWNLFHVLPSLCSQHNVSASTSAHSRLRVPSQAELIVAAVSLAMSKICDVTCSSSTYVPHCNISYRIFIFTSCRVWYIVTGGWRKLHNEELHNLYSLPSIIRVIKSRTMRWAWQVARMGEKRNAYKILVGKT